MRPARPALLLASCLVASSVLLGCGGGESRTVATARAGAREAPPGALPGVESGEAGVLVDVAGAVRRPGVYRLATGSRVHEAIAAAGGARPGADLASLNRAAHVIDGQQLLVGSLRGRPAARGAPAGSAPVAATISVNAAGVEELDQLPGIGPVTAQRIVAEREASGPFASLDDLDRVPGVGPATIEALRDAATT